MKTKKINTNSLAMKKTASIRAHLGLTQADMAKVLGVSRSLYSMHELGNRNLPVGAMQALAIVLTQIDATQSKNPVNEQVSIPTALLVELQKLCDESEYKLKEIKYKIDVLKRRYKASVGAVKVTDWQKNQVQKSSDSDSFLQLNVGVRNTIRASNYYRKLVLLDLQYQTYEARHLIIQHKIIKCSRELDFTEYL